MQDPIHVWAAEGADVRVGTWFTHVRRRTQSSSFMYDSAYLANPLAYAIDPAIPLMQSPHHSAQGRAVFGAFSDAAPDRWGRTLLLRREVRLAAQEGRAARTLGESDFILGVRDDLRQGALRFSDARGTFLAAEDDGVPALTDLPSLMTLAERAERDQAQLPDLERLVHAGGSLGGARPKAHVRTHDGRLAIAKFPSSSRDSWDVITWEWVALELAARAGVSVPAHQLLQLADRNVLIVERFDRVGTGDDMRRVGYLSAMSMLEASDGDRASYLDIASVIEESSDRTTQDLHELWRRVAFGIAIGNTDDHLRNHGFLHAPGLDAWRLAPAFDLNPDPVPGPRVHQTSIDGSDGPSTLRGALKLAPEFRLGADDAEGIASRIALAVADWRDVALQAGISPSEIEAMAPAFGPL